MVSVGFVKGGNAGNVIPEIVKFGGTYRSMSTDGFAQVQLRIREVIFSKLGRNHVIYKISTPIVP